MTLSCMRMHNEKMKYGERSLAVRKKEMPADQPCSADLRIYIFKHAFLL